MTSSKKGEKKGNCTVYGLVWLLQKTEFGFFLFDFLNVLCQQRMGDELSCLFKGFCFVLGKTSCFQETALGIFQGEGLLGDEAAILGKSSGHLVWVTEKQFDAKRDFLDSNTWGADLALLGRKTSRERPG